MTKRIQYVLTRVVVDDNIEAPMDWDWSQILSGPGATVYAEAWGVSDFMPTGDERDEPDMYLPKQTHNDQMGTGYLLEVLCALPSYVEVEFVRSDGSVCRGLTRDLPRAGRRCTVEGWEWFLTEDLFDNIDIIEVRVQGMNLTVVH